MMCLRNICGIRRVDRVRNAIIREMCGCELSALERNERNVFGHVERMGEERLVREFIGQIGKVTGGEGDTEKTEG